MGGLGFDSLALLALAGAVVGRNGKNVPREPPEHVAAARKRAEEKQANQEYAAQWLERKGRRR